MPKIIKNGIDYCNTPAALGKASEILYDNTNTDLTSFTVQSVIGELYEKCDGVSDINERIDELDSSLSALNSNNNTLAITMGDISARLVALESKFSSYQPVKSLSGSYTIGSIAPDGGHHVDKVITFSPAFGTVPTVTARITTDHKYAYISVEDVTQGSCVIKVTNGHSTQTYKNIGVAWSAVANA